MCRDSPGAGRSKSTDMGSASMTAEEQTRAEEEMREVRSGKVQNCNALKGPCHIREEF